MTKHDTDPILSKSRELLDESTEYLDAATQSKLHQARFQALDKVGQDKSNLSWLPVGGLVASLMLSGVYLYQLPEPLPAIYQDPIQQAAAEHIELLEDLEFMAWLVLQESVIEDDTKST